MHGGRGSATGIEGRRASPTASSGARRQPVIIVHIGEGARKMREAGVAGVAAHGAGVGVPAGSSIGASKEGIPVPGTNLVRTTSENAATVDRSVRGHERLHQLALGPYAESGVQLTTRRGADGRQYAVGGRIKADLAPVPGNPEATLRKANAVRRAALAPASPSAADMRVAAEAYRLAQSAKEDIEADRLSVEA